jgi:hypothetical protein
MYSEQYSNPMKRSVAMAIVFTIITCGVYGIYWLYQLLTSLYHLNKQESTAGMDIVFTFITCGIYGIYLAYKIGKMEAEAYRNYGMYPKDDSIMYLVLAIFSFEIIVWAIVQSNINNLIDNGKDVTGAGSDPNNFYDPQRPN